MNKIFTYYKNINQDIFDIKSQINLSFEFFPPKNCIHQQPKFLSAIKRLSVFNPKFISITCSPQVENNIDYTYQAIKSIPKNLNLNIAPHITYINNISNIKKITQKYWDHGIRSIVALRGDVISKTYNSNVYACDLVKLLKQIGDFDISVAAYPEIHPEAVNSKLDLIYLKKKIEYGANRAITQFFFDTDKYLRFRDRCVDIGINIDIIPGILPIINFQQLNRFIKLTNVSVPQWIHKIFNDIDSSNDVNISKMIGLIICVKMIQKLCAEGINNFHFYTLNNFDILYAICSIFQEKIKLN